MNKSEALQEFKDKKEEFYKVINEFPLLKEKTKKEMSVTLTVFLEDSTNATV